MKGKKAQVALFIILAIMILTSLLVIFLLTNGERGLKPTLNTKLDLQTEYNAMQARVQTCLADKTKAGIEIFGLKWSSESEIAHYVESEIEGCIDFPYYEYRGLVVTRGTPTAEVAISDESVLTELDYPISLSIGTETADLEHFGYHMQREKSYMLSLSGGVTTSEARLLTEDGRAELVIPAGIGISDSQITAKVLDWNFDGLENRILIGSTAYELGPDGASFSGPLELIIKIPMDQVPPDINLRDLRIAWYDEYSDLWRAVPTTLDRNNLRLIGRISHFTTFGIVQGCSADSTISQVSMSRRIFTQVCGTEDACKAVSSGPGWSNEGGIAGLHEKETTDQNPVLLDATPEPPLGEVPHTLTCSLKDWDQDDQSAGESISISGLCSGGQYNQVCLDDCSRQAKEYFMGLDPKFFSADSLKDESTVPCYSIEIDNPPVCQSVACANPDKATPQTYGYEDTGQLAEDYTYAGGWGAIYFSIEGRGNACVADSGEANPDIVRLAARVEASSEEGGQAYEVCSDPAGEMPSCDNYVSADASNVVKQIIFNPILTPLQEGGGRLGGDYSDNPVATVELEPVDNGLYAGQNAAYLRVENLDEAAPDGCLWVDAGITLWGTGLAQNEPDTELDTNSEYQDYLSSGYSYGASSNLGYASSYSAGWQAGQYPSMGVNCNNVGFDPEADSTSSQCTDWEKGLAPEQVVALIGAKAKATWTSLKADPDFASQLPDLESFQKMVIGMAAQESSLQHCAASGKVKTGDGGTTVGLMQVPNNPGAYRLASNIDIALDLLVQKFTMVDCRDGYTLECQDTCEGLNPSGVDCAQESRTYKGWECAVRGYNGWGCKFRGATGGWSYCGTDCNGYVEKVNNYANQITAIPSCAGGSSDGTGNTGGDGGDEPNNGGTGNGGPIVDAAEKYLGCNYVWSGISDLDHCKLPGNGFTCATFVHKAVLDACGVAIYGNGNSMCDGPNVESVSASQLQPGDIFSYDWGEWGHTGIYVGTNSNGEKSFIHAWPNRGVSYTTLSFLQSQAAGALRYCRVKNC